MLSCKHPAVGNSKESYSNSINFKNTRLYWLVFSAIRDIILLVKMK